MSANSVRSLARQPARRYVTLMALYQKSLFLRELRESNISGNLEVNLFTGEELSGRWVEGGRDGQGALCGPRLDKVGLSNVTAIS